MNGYNRISRSLNRRALQSLMFRNNRSSDITCIPLIATNPHAYSVQLRAFSTDDNNVEKDSSDNKGKTATPGASTTSPSGQGPPQPRTASSTNYTQAQSEIRSLRAGEALGAMRQYFDKVKEKDQNPKTSAMRESTVEGKTWMALRQEISKSAQARNVNVRQGQGDMDDAEGAAPRPRILNPRMSRTMARPANPRAPSSSGASDDDEEGEEGSGSRGAFKARGAAGGGFKGKRGDEDREKLDGDDDEDRVEMDAITKEMLMDVESLRKDVGYSRDGPSIVEDDEKFISAFDKFLNDTFIESVRSPDGEFSSLLNIDVGYKTGTDTENWRRTRLPRARPMHDLLEVVTPNIYSTAAGSEGYRVAQHAWDIMSKNYYFREDQKEYICNMIAKEIDEVNALVAMEKQTFADEETLKITFYKGGDYLELEKDRNAAIELTQGISEEYKQGATDWQVQAVESEDDLFKDTSSK